MMGQTARTRTHFDSALFNTVVPHAKVQRWMVTFI